MSDLDQSVDLLGAVETAWHPTEPEVQADERTEEKGKVLEGIRLLEEVIDRMNTRIAFYDSVKSLTADLSVTPEEHLREVLAHQLVIAELTQEKEYLEGLRETHQR